jgi:hypothetical protein
VDTGECGGGVGSWTCGSSDLFDELVGSAEDDGTCYVILSVV